MRRGFTLLEMTIATVVFSVVIVSLSGSLSAVNRLIRNSYAEAELATKQRFERERLYFTNGTNVVRYPVENRANLRLVTLDETIGGVRRRERVVMPVFGVEQIRNSTSIFLNDR